VINIDTLVFYKYSRGKPTGFNLLTYPYRCKKIVFLTGVGISQERGISTFRGKDGLWQKYDPMKLASAQAFRDDPKLVWSWYNDRRKKILSAKPNAGHIDTANLQNHREVNVITQNVDGLHHIAGSRDVRASWKHLCN